MGETPGHGGKQTVFWAQLDMNDGVCRLLPLPHKNKYMGRERYTISTRCCGRNCLLPKSTVGETSGHGGKQTVFWLSWM